MSTPPIAIHEAHLRNYFSIEDVKIEELVAETNEKSEFMSWRKYVIQIFRALKAGFS